jgi:hypothetical protein
MICKHCNVDIKCKTLVCPLCHNPLGTDEQTVLEYKMSTRAFPVRKRKRPRNSTKFDLIYFYIAIGLSVASLIANLILTPKILWSFVVVASLIYFYFLVRNTILSPQRICGKVMGQALVLTVLIVAVEIMLSGRFNLYAYALPAVYLVSQGIVGIYILANRKKSTRYLVPLMTMGILGIIPYIIAVFKKLEVLWPSLSVGALSATIILLTVIVEHKAIGQELKRIFHI